MLTVNTVFFSLIIIIVLLTKSCNGKVSCAECSFRNVSLTEPELNTQGCTITDGEMCALSLRFDYTNSNESFINVDPVNTPLLILTNGEPQVSENIFIWLNELRVQRMISIICFSGTSCGLDLMKQIYKEQFRTFDYEATQKKLSDLLYSSSAVGKDLTCSDQSGTTISCPDGFCRSIVDGNGLEILSGCVKKGLTSNPYGLTVTKTIMADLGGEQAVIMFTCNKPMCNKKQTSQTVIDLLASAQLIPKPNPLLNKIWR